MSYDLMVFEPTSAPTGHTAFMTWYGEQTKWAEDHAYNDPKVSTPRLRALFHDIIKQYPAMNGPYAAEDLDDEDEEDALVSDYSVGQSVIYIAFAWSKADGAYEEVLHLATEHQVGFFDVSSSKEEVWLPDGKGGLAIVHQA